MPEPPTPPIQFYPHPQSTALTTFLPFLRPYLPHSNPLYNRLLAPQNHPSRNCLFAATFPPSSSSSFNTTNSPSPFPNDSTDTILFADLSRTTEAQIWAFNPITTLPSPSPSDSTLLTQHAEAIIRFLKSHSAPTSPILRFGCIDSHLAIPIISFAAQYDAAPYITKWNLFMIRTADVAAKLAGSSLSDGIPDGFTVGRVPEDQLDLVISTSAVPRIASTLLTLPNTCLLSPTGALIAWSYLGIDGSLGTLYVVPEYRRSGLASVVAGELITRLERGEFRDLGVSGESGWVHADVKEGNVASEGVMGRLGAVRSGVSYFFWVDGGRVEVEA